MHHKKEEWKGASCVESPGTPPRSGVKSDHILAWQKSCYTASGLKIEINFTTKEGSAVMLLWEKRFSKFLPPEEWRLGV